MHFSVIGKIFIKNVKGNINKAMYKACVTFFNMCIDREYHSRFDNRLDSILDFDTKQHKVFHESQRFL